MVIFLVCFAVFLLFVGLGVGWLVAQRVVRDAATTRDREMTEVMEQAVELVRAERAESLQSSLDAVLSVASSKLGDQLAVGKEVIDRERDSVTSQVSHVQSELRRVGDLVVSLQKERAAQSGQLTHGLEQALQATVALSDTTQSLHKALASPKSRGQWGERMAEDVLTAAGFVEGINYSKQKKLSGGGIPDFSFDLPKGHQVHMDVKFPMDNYMRWLEASSDTERAGFVKAFRRDVRQRVKELSDRDYIDPETTVDYVLLFVPNESVYGFLHEHDPSLVDQTIQQRVVLCSPTTLFAVLAVIRQAVDNFLVERRSDEILSALSGLRDQWNKWEAPMKKMGNGLKSAQKAFDDLAGPRTRQFERQLDRLESFRDGTAEDEPSQEEDYEQKLELDDPQYDSEESETIGVLKSA